MKLKYFNNERTAEENKKLYHKLSKRFHPDMKGGSHEIMQQINEEYNYVKTKNNNKSPQLEKNAERKKRPDNDTRSKSGLDKRINKKGQKIIKSMAQEILDTLHNQISNLIKSL